MIFILFGCSTNGGRGPASSEKSCVRQFERFFKVAMPFGRENIELSLRDVKVFEEKLKSYDQSKHLNPAKVIYIGLDSKIYTMGNEISVRFPEDEHYTQVYIFSGPVKRSGQSVIHLKLWSREGKYFGSDNFILENIPTARLWEIYKESFIKYDLSDEMVVLLPSLKKGNRGQSVFSGWKILEKGKKAAKVVDLNGNTKWVPYEDIFNSNIGLKADESELVNKFFKAGGKGDFVRFKEVNPNYGGMSGIYIKVEELPRYNEFSEIEGILSSEDVYNLLQKNIDEDVSILITPGGRGFNGVHADKKTSLSEFIKNRYRSKGIKKNHLIISNKADVSTVRHELVHLDDDVNGLLVELNSWLEEFEKLHSLPLKIKELMRVRSYILEQRAYAKQIEFLKSLMPKPTARTKASKEKRAFIKNRIENSQDIFKRSYKKKFLDTLDSLEESDFKRELIERVGELLHPSDSVN